jgi:putative FmdB family regulatory protein
VPTYQYACTECGDQLEAVQKFTDDPLTVCETCGGRLRKVFSPVGIVFKGSGFYRTDSRNGSGSSAPAKDAKDAKATESASADSKSADGKASKGDKPAAKSDTAAASSSSGEKAA